MLPAGTYDYSSCFRARAAKPQEQFCCSVYIIQVSDTENSKGGSVIRYGISTACLYPLETAQSLSKLTETGFQLFEIFFNTYGEIRQDYLKKLKSILDSSGASVKSIHPFTSAFESMMFFSDYDSRFTDSLDFYRRYFDAAGYLGARILVLHGQRDYHHSSLSEEEYFERYALLHEAGRRSGILVAQENVNRFRSEDPDFIRRMREYLGAGCCFVLDIKQAVRAGKDPYDMCRAMGDQLIHVHLNDNNRKSDCLLPGQGEMDYEKLKQILQKSGYDGDFIIEVYRSSFSDFDQLLQSKHFVKSLVE